jgi:hypothetical protein
MKISFDSGFNNGVRWVRLELVPLASVHLRQHGRLGSHDMLRTRKEQYDNWSFGVVCAV